MFGKHSTKFIHRNILAGAVLAAMPLTASAVGGTVDDAAYNGEQARMEASHASGTTTFIPKIGDVMVHPSTTPKSQHSSMDVQRRNFPTLPGLDA